MQLPPRASAGPADLWVLTTVAVSALLLFVALAVALTAAGPSNLLDFQLESVLRSVRVPALDAVMFTATYLCSWQVVIAGLVVAMAYLMLVGRLRSAAALLVSVIGDQLIVSALKNVFDRARPDQLEALLPAVGPSFPSGHTFAAVAFYGVLALIATDMMTTRAARRSTGTAVALFIITVGLSRVYLGAHWPSDVLGSWLLGTAWLTLIGIGLELARRLFPSADHQKPGLGNWRFALVLLAAWLAFVIGFGFFQPTLRQSGSIALVMVDDRGQVDLDHCCLEVSDRGFAAHHPPTELKSEDRVQVSVSI